MPLTADALDVYRNRLREERRTVIGNLAALDGDLSTSLSDELEENGQETHLGDLGTVTFLRERDLAISDTEEQVLRQIDAALQRIEDGTYGVCVTCGNPIPAERLEALPWATRDVEHQLAEG